MTFNGSAWTTPTATGAGSLASVSCPSASFCMAAGATVVGYEEHGMAITAPTAVTFDGSAWNKPANVTSIGAFVGLSCVSSTFCLANDEGQPLAFTGTWGQPVFVDDGIYSLSCASRSFCVGTDNAGQAATFNGSSWTPQFAIGGGEGVPWAALISCGSSAFCVAVDQNGRATTYRNGSWGQPTSIDDVNLLTSVSCRTSTFCLVADQDGNVLTFNGSSWSAPTRVADAGWPIAVSCTSRSFCLAARHGEALTFDGSFWSKPAYMPALGGQLAVSCASRSFCAAVGANYALTLRAGAWRTHTFNLPLGELASVSCPKSSFCMAVGSDFPRTAVFTTYDGRSWSKPHLFDRYEMLEAVSCSSTSFCVAVDQSGRAITFNGSRWSKPVRIDYPTLMSSISCPASSFCAALDYQGNALTDTVPSVQIKSEHASVAGQKTQITLACAERSPITACRGTLSLVTRRVVVARSNYAVPPGRQRAITLTLGRRSLQLLAHAGRVEAIASLAGGPNTSRSIALRLSLG